MSTKVEGSPVHLVIADYELEWTMEATSQLNTHPQIKVIGFAQNMETCLDRAVSMQADAILMEYSMPDGTASQVARRIAEDSPGTAVFAVSSSMSASFIQAAKAAGVVELFPKQGFVAREAAGRIADHVDALRREWNNTASKYGTIGKGVGPKGEKIKVEYVNRAITQSVILTHNTKGGVGKSAIASNLAVAIKTSPYFSGQRVVLVDFDCGGANVSTNCHVADVDAINRNLAVWEHVPEDLSAQEVDDLLIAGPKGVMLAAAPINHAVSSRIGFNLADKILRILKRYYAVIVIDGAPNINDPVEAAMMNATHILMIANPEGQAVKQLNRIVQLVKPDPDYGEKANLAHLLKKMFLVLNYAQAATEWDLRKGDVAGTVGLPLFAEVPYDPVVRRALHGNGKRLAVELDENSPFSLAIKRLSNDICGAYPEAAGKRSPARGKTGKGFLRRLFSGRRG